MRKLISILNPVYWTTAQEVGEAVNGYTLTGGTFRRETQVEFATGMEVLVQLTTDGKNFTSKSSNQLHMHCVAF